MRPLDMLSLLHEAVWPAAVTQHGEGPQLPSYALQAGF